MQNVPRYRYDRSAKNDMTVNEWKKLRFAKSWAGFDAMVLDGNGEDVAGNTKLSTARGCYLDDDE